eukprot:c5455_g1_i1.p1 GENE.c5455_g1_i1~~c5455_g1_i1.p1  ORF type:complete len:632 (+),score=155.32 c5455_g1_i1:43-1896(+)
MMKVVALLFGVAQAAHLIELRQRDVPVEEKQQMLELLQLESGATEVPNIPLNSNFFGPLKIGDNQQEFNMVFDTGSDALWVYSDKCEACKVAKKHVFNRGASHSYHRLNPDFTMRYGTGETHGTTGTDRVTFADLEVQSQAFGQCDQPDEVMRNFPFDGIVGLSRPMYMDPNGLSPIIDTIKKEKLLNNRDLANTFAFYLSRDESQKSYLILGGSHHMLHEGLVHWIPTLSKNIFWELPLDDILIHHKHNGKVDRISASSNKPHKTSNPGELEQVSNSDEVQGAIDPYATAPLAEDVTEGANDKLQLGGDWPGVSDDGYSFVTKAEPVLLEMESLVSMLETETNGFHPSETLVNKRHPTAADNHANFKSTQFPARSQHPVGAMPASRIHSRKPLVPRAMVESNKPLMRATQPRQLEDTNLVQSIIDAVNHAGIFNETQGPAAVLPTSSTASRTQPTKKSRGSGELLSDFDLPVGQSIHACSQDEQHPCVASVDSGHSLISGPPELVRVLKQHTMPNGPCTEEATAHLPDVSFVIGGKLFTLEPMDYLVELEGSCVPAFRERAYRNGHDWVLGEHFMRTFYTVFDYDDMRVGLSRVEKIKEHISTIMSHTPRNAKPPQ